MRSPKYEKKKKAVIILLHGTSWKSVQFILLHEGAFEIVTIVLSYSPENSVF